MLKDACVPLSLTRRPPFVERLHGGLEVIDLPVAGSDTVIDLTLSTAQTPNVERRDPHCIMRNFLLIRKVPDRMASLSKPTVAFLVSLLLFLLYSDNEGI